MKIIVCIKQVPDTSDIKWTEKNTMQREGMESVINPFDEFALETAFRLKDANKDIEITVLSMGPVQAVGMLKKAIAYGADKAILLSDKKFAGSDTYATANTLAQAIKNKIPDFDIIICGQFATDGDTGQTGPALASILKVPQVTYVRDLYFSEAKELILTKETEDAVIKLKTNTPIVVCVLKTEYSLRPALIDGYIKAHNTNIEIFGADDIGISPEITGFKGSPTYVKNAFHPANDKHCEFIKKDNTNEYTDFLTGKIQELKGKYGLNDK